MSLPSFHNHHLNINIMRVLGKHFDRNFLREPSSQGQGADRGVCGTLDSDDNSEGYSLTQQGQGH